MESGEEDGDGGLEQSIVLLEALEAPDRCGESETMPEKLECLSNDWTMEACIRNSSKTVGVRDQYYYDLKSHHHFRSKKEVEYFMLTRMIRRYMPKSKKSATNKPPCSSFRSLNQDDSVLKKQSEIRFDFKNHPTKVNWGFQPIWLKGCGLRVRKDCQSLSGNHGWPQRKTSIVPTEDFNSDGEILNTQILKYQKGVIHRRYFLAHSKVPSKIQERYTDDTKSE